MPDTFFERDLASREAEQSGTTIRTEMHPCPWGQEWYAIVADIYDGADKAPLAGVGATEAEAVADLMERIEDRRSDVSPQEMLEIHNRAWDRVMGQLFGGDR